MSCGVPVSVIMVVVRSHRKNVAHKTLCSQFNVLVAGIYIIMLLGNKEANFMRLLCFTCLWENDFFNKH